MAMDKDGDLAILHAESITEIVETCVPEYIEDFSAWNPNTLRSNFSVKENYCRRVGLD